MLLIKEIQSHVCKKMTNFYVRKCRSNTNFSKQFLSMKLHEVNLTKLSQVD